MTVDTPNGPAKLTTATEAKDGGVLFVGKHRNGATWLYQPGDIEPRTAEDAANLDAFIGICMMAAKAGRKMPAMIR